jgi:hypothetical protein
MKIPTWCRVVALVGALVGGAWLLMADSAECSGADNEQLCEKCGSGYEGKEALCQACDDRQCFLACDDNQDPTGCAQRYNACVDKQDGAGSCVRGAVCEGSPDAARCQKCGLDLYPEILPLCDACADAACFDHCLGDAEQSTCAARYKKCQDEGAADLRQCTNSAITGS